MPTITKRGPYQYQAVVRRRGYKTQCRTFESRKAAELWALKVEAEMSSRTFEDPSALKSVTLKDALERYAAEVTVKKKGRARELARIRQLCRHPLAQRDILDIRASDFKRYRDEREQEVSANTVRLELALLSNLYTIAIKEWDWPLKHHLQNVKKPSTPRGRERRLVGDEEQRLLTAVRDPKRCKVAPWLEACIRLAIGTGMRAGEILSLQWGRVDLERRVALLADTKNGEVRRVPLSVEMVELLRQLPRKADDQRVIQAFYDTPGLDRAFRLACRDAGIEGLRFHDLRHEAASRKAPSVMPQVLAKIFGWKTMQMAMRYYNPSDEELVAANDRASGVWAARNHPFVAGSQEALCRVA